LPVSQPWSPWRKGSAYSDHLLEAAVEDAGDARSLLGVGEVRSVGVHVGGEGCARAKASTRRPRSRAWTRTSPPQAGGQVERNRAASAMDALSGCFLVGPQGGIGPHGGWSVLRQWARQGQARQAFPGYCLPWPGGPCRPVGRRGTSGQRIHRRRGRFSPTWPPALGVDSSGSMPGYEDAWYWLWRERTSPPTWTPTDRTSPTPRSERAIAASSTAASRRWSIRAALAPRRPRLGRRASGSCGGNACTCCPETPPMGLRLPLDALPWAPPKELWRDPEPDPFGSPGRPSAAPAAAEATGRRFRSGKTTMPRTMRPASCATALCAQVRDGVLRVFLPPQSRAEHWLELVAAIEDTARTTGLRVLAEGYAPPRDPRLNDFAITPDPGVIEVTSTPRPPGPIACTTPRSSTRRPAPAAWAPRSSWSTADWWAPAEETTVVLGGSTPEDSPFLRRPDLLRSMLGYWLAHPSLSFAFSGMFRRAHRQARASTRPATTPSRAGPGIRQIPRPGMPAVAGGPRAAHNLLADASGTPTAPSSASTSSTPDSASAAWAFLELRSFEMPPHERMSLVQQLLVRALVAKFWEDPWPARRPAGTTSSTTAGCSPTFWNRICRRCSPTCARAGFPSRTRGFARTWSSASPRWAASCAKGPRWRSARPGALARPGRGTRRRRHGPLRGQLARAPAGAGAGATPGRHAVLCNGARVPLHSTGTGRRIGGRRALPRLAAAFVPAPHRRGARPPGPGTLRPVGRPRRGQSATYHVQHPGGRAYESHPVNANEGNPAATSASSPSETPRRPSSPGICPPRPEAPLTLDLRWI